MKQIDAIDEAIRRNQRATPGERWGVRKASWFGGGWQVYRAGSTARPSKYGR